MSTTNYELDYRQAKTYQAKKPADWHQDPPLWLLTLDEYNSLGPGAMLTDLDGKNVIKGSDPIEIKVVTIDGLEETLVNVGVRGHLFMEDEKYIPEGINFPTAS